MPIAMAHRLAKRLADVRKAGVVPYLRPDGKTQVTIEYEDGTPVRVDTVLISAQHREEVDVETLLKPDVEAEVIDPVLREFGLDAEGAADPGQPDRAVRDRRPEGRHRPHRAARSWSTRYGGMAPHGGGCFSRQGPDEGGPLRRRTWRGTWRRTSSPRGSPTGCSSRSRTPSARRIRSRSTIDTFGTEQVDPEKILETVRELFDFRPAAIIRDLDLRRPIYQRDRRVRALRAQGLPLGGDRPRRRPPPGALDSPARLRRSRSTERGGDVSPTLRSALVDVERVLSGPVAVCVDRPLLSLDRPFTYELDASLNAGVGSLVEIPFHGRRVKGWVLGPTDDVPARMLPVRAVSSSVRFFDDELPLLRWVSERYVAPLAAVIGRASRPASRPRRSRRRGVPRRPIGPTAGSAGRRPARRYRRRGAPRRGVAGRWRRARSWSGPRPRTRRYGRRRRGGDARGWPAGHRPRSRGRAVPATARALAEAFGDRVGCFSAGETGAVPAMAGDRRVAFRRRRGDAAGGLRPGPDLGLVWVSRESHPGHREERPPLPRARRRVGPRRERPAPCASSALFPVGGGRRGGRAGGRAPRPTWPPVEVVRPGPEGRAPGWSPRCARRAGVRVRAAPRVRRRAGVPILRRTRRLRAVRVGFFGGGGRRGRAWSARRPDGARTVAVGSSASARGGAERVEEWASASPRCAAAPGEGERRGRPCLGARPTSWSGARRR